MLIWSKSKQVSSKDDLCYIVYKSQHKELQNTETQNNVKQRGNITRKTNRLGVGKQRRPRDVPLVRSKQQNVGTRAVHLVRLAWMNRLLLHRLNAQRIQLLIKHLPTATHTHTK